jgi:hypothetical protein
MSEEQVTEEQQQQTPSEVAKKLGNEVKLFYMCTYFN